MHAEAIHIYCRFVLNYPVCRTWHFSMRSPLCKEKFPLFLFFENPIEISGVQLPYLSALHTCEFLHIVERISLLGLHSLIALD